ncbi:MAG: hypothetical protein IPP51_03395 [Bacteroidetes bacterium]|nr:hypothetical protein [Bacteroidota bacterium]
MAVRFEVSGPGLSGWVTAGSTSFYMPHTCNCPIVASLPVPFSFPQTGNFQIRITTDPLNQYSECDESNNQIIVPISITNFPDYRILSQYIAPSLLNLRTE